MMASAPSSARAGDVPVGAAQMHAGGAHGLGQHRIVVDDQRHAVGGAQALQGRRLFLPQGIAGGLVAVLQPGGTRGQQRRGTGQQARGIGLVRGDQVDAAGRRGSRSHRWLPVRGLQWDNGRP